jgi:Uncharacterized protein conserved in bacteria
MDVGIVGHRRHRSLEIEILELSRQVSIEHSREIAHSNASSLRLRSEPGSILPAAEDYALAVSSEIERKFLISTAPDWLGECSPLRIEQGYLAIAEEAEVRLRRAKGELTLTAKRGHGVVREEIEIALGPGQFAELWPLSTQWRVTKTRHIVPLGDGLRAEVDVYAGPLEGLATAEVEFESEARSRSFRPPDWLDRELTGDARYSNQSLATNGRPMHNSAKDGKERSMASEGKGKTYRLQRNESSADGLRRVVRGRVATASKRLRDAANGDLADSIHGARKDLKKIRAVLRLVRAELGDRRFRAEDRRYRDAGRRSRGAATPRSSWRPFEPLRCISGTTVPPGPRSPGPRSSKPISTGSPAPSAARRRPRSSWR